MRVLVACESSGKVREAFRALGHDAWSCDINGSEEYGNGHHFQCDVTRVLDFGWDLMIGHPPCTYLCNSGVWGLSEHKGECDLYAHEDGAVYCDKCGKVQNRWEDMYHAREFFMTLWNAPIPKICLENPVPHGYATLPKYSQTIQPYQFGDDASKRTCLWLKGLPKLLIPSEELWTPPRIVDGRKRWANQTDSGQNKLGPSVTRASERSRTYDGIANAFANQWGHV